MKKIIILATILVGASSGSLHGSSESRMVQNSPIVRAKERFIHQTVDQVGQNDLDGELTRACIAGTAEQIRDLFKRGAKLYPLVSSLKIEEPTYPAEIAALAGNLPVLKECVKQGFPLRDEKLIKAAAITGQPEILKYLLQEEGGAAVQLTGPTGIVTLEGLLKCYNYMVQMVREEATILSENDLLTSGYFDCLDVLVDAGVSLNCLIYGEPSVFAAYNKGGILLLKKFLSLGAHHYGLNKQGYTILHAAVMQRDAAAVRLLLDAGAELHTINKRGETPLKLLLGMSMSTTNDVLVLSRVACLKAFLEAGADFIYAQNGNRISSQTWLTPLQELNKEPAREREVLSCICDASYVLFLPTDEEVEKARKNLLHLIWCLKQNDSACSAFDAPYLQRDFIMHSPLKDELIKLYLVRLRNVNPHGVAMFTGIEDQVADYLYRKIYALYSTDNPEVPSMLQTTLTKDEFKEFVMSHVQEALDRRAKALRDRDRKRALIALSSTSSEKN